MRDFPLGLFVRHQEQTWLKNHPSDELSPLRLVLGISISSSSDDE